MKNLIAVYFFTIALTACKQEQTTGMKAGNNLERVAVANKEDPVCLMKTDNSLHDTLVISGSVYGFCSADCKEKFRKQPEAYRLQ